MKYLRYFAGLCALWAASGSAFAQACPVKMGAILTMTGTFADVGVRIANTAKMAVEDVNAAGGVKGCPVELLLRDDQGSPQVGVDAAKNMVDVQGVPVLIGAIGSNVSLAILSSVAAPSKVTQISCCSTALTFTQLGKDGKTGGYWFRTIGTAGLQGVVSAKVAIDQGWKSVAVLYLNNEFGKGVSQEFVHAMKQLGGPPVNAVAFNDGQTSYAAVVGKAMESKPDALFVVAEAREGAVLVREWLSMGGTQNLLLNNALRSDLFIKNVGAEYLNKSWGVDFSPAKGPSTDAFAERYKQKFGAEPNGPGLNNIYDAVVLSALAMQAAPSPLTGTGVRDNVRRVLDPAGTVARPGAEGIRGALDALKAGRKVHYVGATGLTSFDENGDVSSPMMVWRITDGKIKSESVLPVEEVTALVGKVGR